MSAKIQTLTYRLSNIRPILTTDIILSIAAALVLSRVDYTNSVLYRNSFHNINKLLHVQIMAAWLFVGSR
jgi:hypothetical protein